MLWNLLGSARFISVSEKIFTNLTRFFGYWLDFLGHVSIFLPSARFLWIWTNLSRECFYWPDFFGFTIFRLLLRGWPDFSVAWLIFFRSDVIFRISPELSENGSARILSSPTIIFPYGSLYFFGGSVFFSCHRKFSKIGQLFWGSQSVISSESSRPATIIISFPSSKV